MKKVPWYLRIICRISNFKSCWLTMIILGWLVKNDKSLKNILGKLVVFIYEDKHPPHLLQRGKYIINHTKTRKNYNNTKI